MASKPSLANIHYQKAHISESRVGSIIAANVICYTIGCLAVVLRFVSRRLSNIKYEWDDWLVVAGLVRPFFSQLPCCILVYDHEYCHCGQMTNCRDSSFLRLVYS